MFLIKFNSIPWEMTLSCPVGCESEDSTFQSSINAEFYKPCESSAFLLDFKAWKPPHFAWPPHLRNSLIEFTLYPVFTWIMRYPIKKEFSVYSKWKFWLHNFHVRKIVTKLKVVAVIEIIFFTWYAFSSHISSSSFTAQLQNVCPSKSRGKNLHYYMIKFFISSFEKKRYFMSMFF